MNKNRLSVLNTLVIAGLLVLAGCVSTENTTTGTSKVAKIDFNLPQQVKWKQIKNQQQNGDTWAEWIPATNKDNNTAPVRVVYQRKVSNQSAKEFLLAVAQPLKKMCGDLKATVFKTNSTYANQMSIEAVCSRFAKAGFGTVSYLTAYSDGQADYFLISEVKLPASEKAGSINPKNEQEKKWAKTAVALAKVMKQFNKNTRFCDATGKCQ